MIRVTATKLRNNLFEFLDRAAAGESIIVERNQKEVARLVPTDQPDWRDEMKETARFLVSPESLVEPLEGVWEDYA